MGKRPVSGDHYIVSMGRSSVACRCGWGETRMKLCVEPEKDREALRKLHAQHVIEAAKGAA